METVHRIVTPLLAIAGAALAFVALALSPFYAGLVGPPLLLVATAMVCLAVRYPVRRGTLLAAAVAFPPISLHFWRSFTGDPTWIVALVLTLAAVAAIAVLLREPVET